MRKESVSKVLVLSSGQICDMSFCLCLAWRASGKGLMLGGSDLGLLERAASDEVEFVLYERNDT